MFRKMICILTALGMFLVFRIPVYATCAYGSISVIPQWKECNFGGAVASLYRVGDLTDNGCTISDGLADWNLSWEEIATDAFLQWASEQHWEEETSAELTEEQGICFTNLKEGLYLIAQKKTFQEHGRFEPFFAQISMNTGMDITCYPLVNAVPELPRTGDYPAPIFAAMALSLGTVFLVILIDNRRK